MQKYSKFIVRKCNRNLLWKQNNSKDKQSVISRTHNHGVRQGCILSPTLFNIYMNETIVKWNYTYTKGITLSTSTKINTLHFASDQVVIADSEDNLQRRVFALKQSKNVWNGQ
jgi:hypothetical protein